MGVVTGRDEEIGENLETVRNGAEGFTGGLWRHSVASPGKRSYDSEL